MKPEIISMEECFGNRGCPNSLGNTTNLKSEIEKILTKENIKEFILEKVKGKPKFHNSFRVGISNCPNACSQIQIKDIGIMRVCEVEVDSKKCSKCGACEKMCPDRAIKLTENGIEISKEACLGCGLCVRVCKEKALSVKKLGYKIFAGGKLGRHPQLAYLVLNFCESEKELLDTITRIIYFYKENCVSGERLGSIIQRIGFDVFKNKIKEG